MSSPVSTPLEHAAHPAESRSQLGTVLVTGTSSGIGQATAAALAKRGYHVIASVRKLEHALPLTQASDLVEPIELDIADHASVETLGERLARLDRGLVALVNNAGIIGVGPIELLPPERWTEVVQTNIVGTINVTRVAIPALIRAKGRVINVGSPSGKIALPMYGPYSVSKFALEAFGHTLRRELTNTGVKVTMVSPGFISTPIFDKGVEEGAARIDAGYHDQDLRDRYAEMAFSAIDAGRDARLKGASPDVAAKLIIKALRAKRPLTRYAGGVENRAVNFIVWAFPPKLLDLLLQKIATTEAR